jgi:hypothetical protein
LNDAATAVALGGFEDDSGDLIGAMGIWDACDPIPILHALSRTAFPGRGIGGQFLPRLLALADPGRPIPVGTRASADPAGRYLVVLADGRRYPACWAFGAARRIDINL